MYKLFILFAALLLSPIQFGVSAAAPAGAPPEATAHDPYHELRLKLAVSPDAFDAAIDALTERRTGESILAVVDMTLPSTAKRLAIVDLSSREVLLSTWVAHGQNSGDLMARSFSNRHGSHQTSLGLYRVGARITSPRHGPALLLHGLEPGVNDQALAREIIIHGADYVSADFIARNGRLGRSWGCPAVPREHVHRITELLADGGHLFVFGG